MSRRPRNEEAGIPYQLAYVGLKHKIEAMEKKYNAQFKIVFKAIKKLLEPTSVGRKKIGFHSH